MESSTTHFIVESLTRAIVEHRLQPGTKLAEQKLADHFGVSRTLVRQALFQLAQNRLIRLEPARGAFVAAPTVEEARQVFAVRRMLEAEMTRSFAREVTPAKVRALREHIAAERAADDRAERNELLGDFHVRMAELMGNEVLAQILRDLVSRSSLISLMYQREGAARHSQEEHVEIVRALAARDEAPCRTPDAGAPGACRAEPGVRPQGADARCLAGPRLSRAMVYDSTAPYPRDLVGYGRNPPHAQWPGDARVAVQFVLNYEEGGENSVLHGDAGSEQFLSEMFNPASYPARHLSMEGIYEYGSRAGVWRILREFERRGLPLTVFGVGMALQRHAELTAAFKELGHEIACHGLRWIHYQDIPEAVEREHMAQAMQVIEQLTGERPLGWYTGRDSPNTRRLVADFGGFEYDSDYYGDDLPFWMKVRKTDGSVVPHLVVPYALDTNDMRFSLPQGFAQAEDFFIYLRDSFDALYARGRGRAEDDERGHALPPARAARPHRGAAEIPGPCAGARTGVDLPPHRHRAPLEADPPLSRLTVTILDPFNTAPPAEAARLLDGVYEHSPWIAQAALAQRPFQSLAQLKHAMARIVAGAGRDAQLALVRAHPELAGKARVGQALTAESSGEQSRAGLAECTPQEFAKLQQLNAAYNAKFGFPFILAVRGPRGTGLTRREIIETFERRLDNPADFELAECLRNIHRIAELRLNDKFGVEPVLGNRVWDWHEALAEFSDPGFKENGQLTVTYLTDAHRAAAARISQWMRECGFDEVSIDAVGNVVGRYRASPHPSPPPKGEGKNQDPPDRLALRHRAQRRQVRRAAGHLHADGLRA